MNQNEMPASKREQLDALQSRLDAFVGRSAITKFAGEDIMELVQEGEGIDWIVDQLKGESPDIDVDEITVLLRHVQALAGPERNPEEEAEKPTEESGPQMEEAALETGMPDASELDLSQLDLSQLAAMLPPGMKLPPGLDAGKLQEMLESPQGKFMTDFLLFCRERGVDLDAEYTNDPRVRQLQKEWQSTPREAFEGKRPSEVMQDFSLFGKVETYRREEPRVGRNDPCPCRSGKKYKKCCGRK
jgi:hypothetical protein